MLFVIPEGFRRMYRNIRTVISRRRNSPLESPSSQSSSSTSIELQQTSFTEIIQHPQEHELPNSYQTKLRQLGGEHLQCQAVQQGRHAAEYKLKCLLFVNITPPALLGNVAAQFTAERNGPIFFWLKNNCIKGYIGLDENETIFAIVSNKQSEGCKFRMAEGYLGKIQVQGKHCPLYMKVHETDGMLVTTTSADDATAFYTP